MPENHIWHRERPFVVRYLDPVPETWTYTHGALEVIHRLEVTYGKPLDPIALKQDVVRHFREKVASVRRSRTRLYSGDRVRVEECPICRADPQYTGIEVEIYRARYIDCASCSHCYVAERPTTEALQAFYTSNTDYSATYTDRDAANLRIREVALPKLEFVLRQYRQIHGRDPRLILDVGAGGGHFVQACREMQIDATGLELSESSRKFARDVFDITLRDELFDDRFPADPRPDIITFWGLIEHVPEPLSLLRQAQSLLNPVQGLTVASAPNWSSLSSAVQMVRPNRIVRHLDPLGHIHVFTEASLATAFQLTRHRISAAWHFGMDAFEWTIQWADTMGVELSDANDVKELVQAAQTMIDTGGIADSMVVVGVAEGE